jgi:hypothetical protein
MTVPRHASLPDAETQMLDVRRAFERAFKAVVFSVIVLVGSTGLAILFVAFRQDSQLSEKLLVARFIQVSFGMTIGSGCVFLGVILIWLGITASVSVSATGSTVAGTGRFGLSSASPGVIIALAGIVLIALSLYRPVGYTDTLIPEEQMVPSGVRNTLPSRHAQTDSWSMECARQTEGMRPAKRVLHRGSSNSSRQAGSRCWKERRCGTTCDTAMGRMASSGRWLVPSRPDRIAESTECGQNATNHIG